LYRSTQEDTMRGAVTIGSLVPLSILLLFAPAQAETPPSEPISKGQRTFTAGNSFHWWVPAILAQMAIDAGYKDHLHFGVSAIGSSRVIQHWELPDDKNPVKKALRQDKIDVLTLSGMYPPDDGVEKFARLGLEHNPNFRITLQEFWLPNDCYDPTLSRQKRIEKNDHDVFSGAELRRQHAPYFQGMDELVRGINQKLGRPVVFVVPTGQAVIRLREKIIAGQVPDFSSQTELFHDDAGHPFEPIQVLAGYCHFAVIYRQSPVGLPVPYLLKGTGNPKYDKEGQGFSSWWYARHPDPKTSGKVTPEDVRLNRLLQELAWDAVIHHPLSGLYVGKSSAAEARDPAMAHKAWLAKLQAKAAPAMKRTVNAVSFNSIVEQVKDPATRSGVALQARQTVAKPCFMATGTFSTFECFGKYRVTFRLKCSDNRVKEDVCAIGAGGATRGEAVTRTLKGTDFATPDKYQDFSIELVRGDLQPFFYTLVYYGHADVSADTFTSELIGETTDRELLEKYSAGATAKVKPADRRERQLLWVQGPFQGVSQELDPFATAIRELKIPYQISSVDIPGRTVSDFPKDASALAKYSLVVLSNVNPRALGFVGRNMLKTWVEQGGTLIITGGPCAFGKGQTKGTTLEDLYPIQVTPDDLTDGGSFQPGEALPPTCPPYRGQAGSYLIHRATAKPGVMVVLRCNGCPLLAYQNVGLGTVMVFTGTGLENERKLQPFWSDQAWGQWSTQFLRAILP
jgi:uncharacterized membrane protein